MRKEQTIIQVEQMLYNTNNISCIPYKQFKQYHGTSHVHFWTDPNNIIEHCMSVLQTIHKTSHRYYANSPNYTMKYPIDSVGTIKMVIGGLNMGYSGGTFPGWIRIPKIRLEKPSTDFDPDFVVFPGFFPFHVFHVKTIYCQKIRHTMSVRMGLFSALLPQSFSFSLLCAQLSCFALFENCIWGKHM